MSKDRLAPTPEFVKVTSIEGPGLYVLDPDPRKNFVGVKPRQGYYGELAAVAGPALGLVLPSLITKQQFPQAEFSIFEPDHTQKDHLVPARLVPAPDFKLEFPVSILDVKIEIEGAIYLYELMALDNLDYCQYISGIARCAEVRVDGNRLKVRGMGPLVTASHLGSNDNGTLRKWVGQIRVSGAAPRDPFLGQVIASLNRWLAHRPEIPVWRAGPPRAS